MNAAIESVRRLASSRTARAALGAALAVAAVAAVCALIGQQPLPGEIDGKPLSKRIASSTTPPGANPTTDDSSSSIVQLEPEQLPGFQLRTVRVSRQEWPETISVTGRIELDRNRFARVSALVPGAVCRLCVEIGQRVEEGDVLLHLNSREVGRAKLQFVQDQAALEACEQMYQRRRTIHTNTIDLLASLEKHQDLDAIEQQFRGRVIGNYRQQLISAVAEMKRARADYDRVRTLSDIGVLAGKEGLLAKTALESAKA
ncbi:MAG TPA: biotin/lipoyl-binding protein, partial [Planctomycetaceae bacterium]|nr:biotin/lipoyl-binding protein [Planctomycetaceae bacterium]